MRFRHLAVLGLALTAAACATSPDASVPADGDYSAILTRPAPRARLYADCISQAARSGAYGHASDDSTDLILFTCVGMPARAFFDGLSARSAAIDSEFEHNGRTYRSTNKVVRDLFGVDYCSTDGAGDYACVITLNAGEFLRDE